MDSLIDCGKPVCKKLLVTPCLRNYRMDGLEYLKQPCLLMYEPAHVLADRYSVRTEGAL